MGFLTQWRKTMKLPKTKSISYNVMPVPSITLQLTVGECMHKAKNHGKTHIFMCRECFYVFESSGEYYEHYTAYHVSESQYRHKKNMHTKTPDPLPNVENDDGKIDDTDAFYLQELKHRASRNMDESFMSPDREVMPEKLTAYHESGHAIVAFNTEAAYPIHKATILPRGSALGMVTQLPSDDQTSISKKQLLASLDVCMGGRVAEELIFGKKHVTTGATMLANSMIVVSNPDVRGRQEILELYLQEKPLADDIDIKAIACGTPGFNGADLANLVNIAATKAAVERVKKLTATQFEFAKDRIMMGTERKTMFQSEESKKLTAYHESGHAIVSFNTEAAYPTHKAMILPRGSSLGMVTKLPSDDQTSISKKQLLARLDFCMGGRVAEELIFGKEHATTGASDYLKAATKLANSMATIMPRGSALGMVTQLPSDDETLIRKKQLLPRLDVCMGGRAVEELIVGQEHVTTGASSDLKKTTDLAQNMVAAQLDHFLAELGKKEVKQIPKLFNEDPTVMEWRIALGNTFSFSELECG